MSIGTSSDQIVHHIFRRMLEEVRRLAWKATGTVMSLDAGMVSPTTVLVAGTVGLLSYFVWSHRRPKGVPPGPVRVPIMGTLAFSGDNNKFLDELSDLRKEYGDILSVYMADR